MSHKQQQQQQQKQQGQQNQQQQNQQSQQSQQQLSAQEILNDALTNEKHLTNLYNTAANEATNDSLRQDMLNILMDEHNMEASIFNTMQQRGMYNTKQASSQEITQAQQKYATKQQQQQQSQNQMF
ncbi:spore coat protein [Proteinivorax hydrogeniformans]|uniref:Spore coat protein n=1 Tax=Proteinivorax hydrogeniformans TaxID=1826727 RepID=A0AAU8HW76_9FIRM